MENYFSKNLVYLRQKRNLSQNRLGQLCGVNASTIKRWEEGTMSPGIDKVDTISKFFNIPISFILSEDLRKSEIEEISKDEFETIAKDWIKSTNKTPEEKQKFLRELARLVDEEE